MLWDAMSVEVSGGLEPLRRVLGFGVMVLERSEGSEPLWTNDHHDGARGSMRMYSIHRCKYYSSETLLGQADKIDWTWRLLA